MDVEAQLRAGLTEKAGTMHAPLDPYASFISHEKKNRRTRRTRLGVVALVVAAVVGASGVVGLNRTSGTEPAKVKQEKEVSTPEPATPQEIAAATKALLDSPLRGSLAKDKAWLNRARAFVAGEAADRLNRPVDKKDVQFLYAGEIGDTRQVVAYVPAKTKAGKDASKMYWFQGPAGDDRVKQLSFGSSSEPITTATAAFAWKSSSNDEDGYVLALAPAGTTLTAGTGLTFRADGTAVREEQTGEKDSGLLEVVLPPDPSGRTDVTVNVTRDGETQPVVQGGNSWGWTGVDGLDYQNVVDAAMGERKPEEVWGKRKPADQPGTANWLQESLTLAQASLETAEVKVPWAGLIDGKPAIVFTVHEPGQGFLAFAWRGSVNGFNHNDYRVLMPAEGAEQRPIAYRVPDEQDGETSNVNAIGPPGTTRLQLQIEGEAAQDLDLDASRRAEAVVEPDQVATVTAFDASGNEIGSTPVLPFAEKGTVGEAEGTRLVP